MVSSRTGRSSSCVDAQRTARGPFTSAPPRAPWARTARCARCARCSPRELVRVLPTLPRRVDAKPRWARSERCLARVPSLRAQPPRHANARRDRAPGGWSRSDAREGPTGGASTAPVLSRSFLRRTEGPEQAREGATPRARGSRAYPGEQCVRALDPSRLMRPMLPRRRSPPPAGRRLTACWPGRLAAARPPGAAWPPAPAAGGDYANIRATARWNPTSPRPRVVTAARGR